MTVAQILAEVLPHKPMSAPTLYKHLRELKIKPVGAVRQCPAVYPEDTPARILKRLGVAPKKAGAR